MGDLDLDANHSELISMMIEAGTLGGLNFDEDGEGDKLLASLRASGLETVSSWGAYEYGALVGLGNPGRPAALRGLAATLLATADPPSDTATFRETLVTLAKLACRKYSCDVAEPETVRANRKRDADGDDDSVAGGAYKSLLYYQNKSVRVDQRVAPTVVASAVRDVKESFYPHSIPSVMSMPMDGGTAKRRSVKVGTAVTFEIGDDPLAKTKAVASKLDVQQNLRILCDMLSAVMGQPISKEAFGGGPAGYVTMPGEAKEVRMLLTAEMCEQLLWQLIGSGKWFTESEVREYGAMIDGFFEQCRVKWSDNRLHPDDVVTMLLETRPALRTNPGHDGLLERAEAIAAATAAAAAASPAPVSASGANEKKGICASWLQNGSCAHADCPLEHPGSGRGALMGRGGGRQNRGGNNNGGGGGHWGHHGGGNGGGGGGGGGGGNWNDQWGGGGQQQWNGGGQQQRSRSKGGGGKGGGGKGGGGKGGKGGGKGWSWN